MVQVKVIGKSSRLQEVNVPFQLIMNVKLGKYGMQSSQPRCLKSGPDLKTVNMVHPTENYRLLKRMLQKWSL